QLNQPTKHGGISSSKQQLQHRRPVNEATAERSKLQQRTANTNTRKKEQMHTHIHTCTTK
ncbi:unnamed protein product, partial [Ceratitis capitata]